MVSNRVLEPRVTVSDLGATHKGPEAEGLWGFREWCGIHSRWDAQPGVWASSHGWPSKVGVSGVLWGSRGRIAQSFPGWEQGLETGPLENSSSTCPWLALGWGHWGRGRGGG